MSSGPNRALNCIFFFEKLDSKTGPIEKTNNDFKARLPSPKRFPRGYSNGFILQNVSKHVSREKSVHHFLINFQ